MVIPGQVQKVLAPNANQAGVDALKYSFYSNLGAMTLVTRLVVSLDPSLALPHLFPDPPLSPGGSRKWFSQGEGLVLPC